MKIIKIHYKKSKQVESYDQIKDQAEEMKAFIKANDFSPHPREPYAIHHSQVSEDPYNFFVINEKYLPAKMFEGDVIVNPKVIGVLAKSLVRMNEGCMSFPHRLPKRVDRYADIKVEYSVVVDGKLVKKDRRADSIFAQIFQHECDHAEGKNIFYKE